MIGRLGCFLLLAATLRAAAPVDVLIQGAEWPEVQDLISALGPTARERQVGNYRFWVGRIGPHPVAVSLTGQALINCTIATVIGVEEFRPRLIINQGTSGAQVPGLGLHDIVVGRRCVDYSLLEAPPRAAGQGSRPLDWRPSAQILPDPATGGVRRFPEGFPGDAEMIGRALATTNPDGRVLAGVIGSAHEVNLELDRVRWSHDTFGMDVEEMESAHVAALAQAYGIRCIAFRVVSDAPYDGIEFQPAAARVTARFTARFVADLPAFPAPSTP